MHLVATWLGAGVLAIGAALPAVVAAPQEDEATSAETLFIRAGKVIVRPGEVLEDASVIVEDGRIVAVGTELEVPEGARELSGAVVCAAFIDPWSSLGVASGAASDRATTAASRTLDAVDLYSSEHARREALRSGVTCVRAQAGASAKFGGIGVITRIAPGLDRDEAIVLEDSNVAASVGISSGRSVDPFDRIADLDRLVDQVENGRKYREDWVEHRHELEEWTKAIAEKEKELEEGFKKAKKDRDKEIEKAKEKGKEHKEEKYKEDKKPSPPKYDEDKEVFARVADGELPLVVQTHRAAELRGLLDKTEKLDRLRLVVAGGTEALAVADKLAKRDIPVIVWPAPLGTLKADELAGHDLSLAGRLADKGVDVLIGSGGGSTARDLPLLAGLAIGHGLDRDAALAALTTTAARTLDVADRLGSVERGKEAELLILDGEPLVSTTRVQFVVSAGRVALSPQN